MKTILVPTDFSITAQYALDFAYHLAQRTDAKLVITHAVEIPIGGAANPVGLPVIPEIDASSFKFMTRRAQQQMEQLLSVYDNDLVPMVTNIELGSPFLTIAESINTHNVDMVVMGTHGASGLKETFLGSNAEKVVRYTSCPVITLKKDADPSQMKSIVFASDFVHLDDQVIMHLKQLQNVLGATIHFVRINTPNNFQRDRVIRKFAEAMMNKHMFKDYTINVYNDLYEEDGIANFAESINADMLALATHGRTGLSHLMTGSLAEDLVNHAKRPVWTYHIGQGSKKA